jgi:hypothetical protein
MATVAGPVRLNAVATDALVEQNAWLHAYGVALRRVDHGPTLFVTSRIKTDMGIGIPGLVPVTSDAVAILDALGYQDPAGTAQLLHDVCADKGIARSVRHNAYVVLCQSRLFSRALVTCDHVGFKGRSATPFELFVVDGLDDDERPAPLSKDVRDKLVARMRSRLLRRFPDLAGKLAAADEQARVYHALEALRRRLSDGGSGSGSGSYVVERNRGDDYERWNKFVALHGVLTLTDLPEADVAARWAEFRDAGHPYDWPALVVLSEALARPPIYNPA